LGHLKDKFKWWLKNSTERNRRSRRSANFTEETNWIVSTWKTGWWNRS
jgi:hypothetical protein